MDSSMEMACLISDNRNCLIISKLVFILRPSIATFRPYFLAISIKPIIRSTCEEKVAISTRPGASVTILSTVSITALSEIAQPARSTPVESIAKNKTFRSLKILYCANSFSAGTPFLFSTRTSPVKTKSPSGVSIITPAESGIE